MKFKRTYIIIGTVLLFLVVVRMSLPFIAKHYINKQLDEIEGYHASIDGVSMLLIAGSFGINGLTIYEEMSEEPEVPMIHLPQMDFSIDWKALFKGHIVSEIHLDSPEINFTVLKDDTDEESRVKFAEALQEMSPIDINHLTIHKATIAYRDPTVEPAVEVFLDDFNLEATNLSNVENEEEALPGYVEINSKAMGDGQLNFNMKVNILKEYPDFDMNLEIENFDLVRFNDFFEAYASLELKDGRLNMYSEMAAENGEIAGYVKPIIEDFEVEKNAEDQNLPEKIYSALADLVGGILENPKKEKIASRVEVSGHMEDMETDTWQAVFNLLRNAFIEAYEKELENAINFQSVGGSE